VAEDNPVNQRVALGFLKVLGYDAAATADGAEAVLAWRGGGFDAILMDCQMPGMDGYQATGEIRRHEGPARRTPIIGLTASAMVGDREKALAAGMDDYLTKPITPEGLDLTLRRWIGPARPPAAPASQPVNPEVLRELAAATQPGFVEELVEVFLKTSADRLAALREADARKDVRGFLRIVHDLRGAAGTVGAVRMQELCGRIEEAGEAGLAEGGARLLEALEADFAGAREALTAGRSRAVQ
jgi:CheY-like chemotaxis protein